MEQHSGPIVAPAQAQAAEREQQKDRATKTRLLLKRWSFKGKHNVTILGIFCLAFVVRFVYNVTAARNYVPIYDANLYNIIAQNLLDKHCYCLHGLYPTVSRAPLWPWIISSIYFFTGPQSFYARLFYCFLGSGTCLFIYRFTSDLFGRRIALCTGVIAATYTGLFLYDGWLYTESLYTFCVTGFAYSLFRLQHTTPGTRPIGRTRLSAFWRAIKEHQWAILCGLFIGAASLTRPNGLLLIGLVCLWALILIRAHLKPWREMIGNALLITGIAILLVAPWTYRNYLVTQAFVPVETGMGEVLLGSYNDVVADPASVRYGFWRPPNGARNHDDLGYTPADDTIDTEKALAWMRAHLTEVASLMGLHVINMWQPYTYSHGLPIEEYPGRLSSRFIGMIIPLESIPIFLLAAFGLFFTWKQRKKELLVIYLVVAATIVQNVVFYGMMRFRAPIEPLLVILTGGALWWLISRWQHTRMQQRFLEKEALQ